MTDPSGNAGERTRGTDDLLEVLSSKVVGQEAAMRFLVPYVRMYQAGLSPADRPAGVFMLLGPTGTGKTRTVEALADVLHGSPRQLLKIDCGEFQSDHEVAKLIGAPPGYVGHRESKPLLTLERLANVTTPGCDLALVLFDEVEKAAPALTTLLLGVLDRGTLRLGDNTDVGFEKTLIFLTSNLGAREMLRQVQPEIGFQTGTPPADLADRLESIGLAAVRKRFSPEFVNRIDVVITYQPLDADALAAIVEHHVDELQHHVHSRLGSGSFAIEVTPAARRLLVERGTSPAYGARELKRTVHRLLTQPLAELVAERRVPPGATVVVDADPGGQELVIAPTAAHVESGDDTAPAVLIVDDNPHLREWLRRGVQAAGFDPAVSESLEQGFALVRERRFDVALIDVMLPDGDGLELATHLSRSLPTPPVILMSGMELSPDEAAIRERHGFDFLRKPFLLEDAVSLLRALIVTRPRTARETERRAGH